MKVKKQIVIGAPVDSVWKVVGEEFEQAEKWMSIVRHSFALNKHNANVNPCATAPVHGRVCQFSDKPNGLYAEEVITDYDSDLRRIAFEVVPRNAPKLLPVKRNLVTIQLTDLGWNKTQVDWLSEPELKPAGYLLAPLLKLGFSKQFGEILKELEQYCTRSVSQTAAVA